VNDGGSSGYAHGVAKKTIGKGAKAKAKLDTPASPAASRSKLIERSVAAKQKRLLREARTDIALIKRRQARIAEDFFDIGEALVRLKRPGVVEALGRASFAELCERDLGMSLTKASYLIAVVQHVPRVEAARLGQDRTVAILELADATPDADTVAALAKGVVKLPDGTELHIPDASANEIRKAAKLFRAANSKGTGVEPARRRGRTTTPEERAKAEALERRLRERGLDRVKVTAVATKPGRAADVRIEHMPLDQLAALKKAL
jgi:hypothetical protein